MDKPQGQLGNRYKDILIPIPKDKAKLNEITADVASSIERDVEA